MHEKRVHSRVPLNTETWVEAEGRPMLTCLARDISLGGMYIESDQQLPFGLHVTVVVNLPGHAAPLRLPAIVRWAKPGGFGVQFGLLGAHATHLITSLGSRQLPAYSTG